MSVRKFSSYTTYTANDRGAYNIPLIGAQFILVAYLEIDKEYDEETSVLYLGTSEMGVGEGHGTRWRVLSPCVSGGATPPVPSMIDFSQIRLVRSSGRWGYISIKITAFAIG